MALLGKLNRRGHYLAQRQLAKPALRFDQPGYRAGYTGC
jgi:hypothetical protein